MIPVDGVLYALETIPDVGRTSGRQQRPLRGLRARARLAPTVATIPPPRLQAASRGTGWRRRLASSATMDAAQMSPSTVNGTPRRHPASPCERTSSYACW